MTLTLIALVVALLGLLILVLGLLRLFKRQWLTGIGMGSIGLGMLVVVVLVLLVGTNLRTYQRLVFEAPVAQVIFQQLSPQRYKVELINIRSGERNLYELLGDEWQMDAQIITWHGLATLVGLDPRYQLQRLSGRYSDVNAEQTSPRTVYDLMPETKVDIWSYIKPYQQWITWVDVNYGSAVYLPMADDASYSITISRSGLVVRPDNLAAEEAVRLWNRL